MHPSHSWPEIVARVQEIYLETKMFFLTRDNSTLVIISSMLSKNIFQESLLRNLYSLFVSLRYFSFRANFTTSSNGSN